MDDKKKIILIKGGKSRWFEQAIFILKDKEKAKNMPKNFVEEAEKIINNYMIRNYSSECNVIESYTNAKNVGNSIHSKAKKKKFDKFLNVLIILSCILIGLILYYFN